MTVKEIERSVLRLSPAKRLHIIEHIVSSLNVPDPSIERAWGAESDKRLKAYKNGRIKGLSLESVRKRLPR